MIIFSRNPPTYPEGCEKKWDDADSNYVVMATESLKAEAREKWVTLYKQIRNVSVAARRCGIARSTLQRWRSAARIKREDENLFTDRSHRPHRLGRQKYRPEDEAIVLKVRDEFNYGNSESALNCSGYIIWKFQLLPYHEYLKSIRLHQFSICQTLSSDSIC